MEGTERTDETLYTEWEPEAEQKPGNRKGLAAAVAGGLALVAATSTWLFVRGRRKDSKLARRLPKYRRALQRAADDPDKVASKNPGVFGKMLAAAGTTAATMLTKRVAERAWARYAHRYPVTSTT